MPDLECPRLEVLIDQNKDINKLYNTDPEFKEVWDDAIELQDCLSAVGVHACGVCISDEPLYNYIPLWDSKGSPVTQYDGSVIESTGCVKIDVLGLSTITILKDAARLIKRKYGTEIDYYSLPLDDAETYKTISTSNNLGVFQIEGSAISAFANSCQPKNIHDIAIIVATYRPGPLALPGLIQRIAGKIRGDIEREPFMFPKYDHLFKHAHGELVYQEGFMALAMEMSGFTEIEADKLRKAVGKKDAALLESLHSRFVEGAVANGEDRSKLEQFWADLMEFARYAFNAHVGPLVWRHTRCINQYR